MMAGAASGIVVGAKGETRAAGDKMSRAKGTKVFSRVCKVLCNYRIFFISYYMRELTPDVTTIIPRHVLPSNLLIKITRLYYRTLLSFPSLFKYFVPSLVTWRFLIHNDTNIPRPPHPPPPSPLHAYYHG